MILENSSNSGEWSMNKQKIGALMISFFIFMFLLLCLGGVLLWLAQRYSPLAPDPTEREIVLLPDLKWRAYDRLRGEVQDLVGQFRWQMEKPGREPAALTFGEQGLLAEEGKEALRIELAERQALLTEEIKLRRRLIDLEINSRLQQRKNHTAYLLKKAEEERRQQQATELADFQRQKEKEYSIKLAALRFKMEIPDLTSADRSRLAAEVAALEEELAALIEDQSETFQQELAQYVAAQQQAALVELEAYRRQLEAEGNARFDREQRELEEEFNAWLQRNEAVQALLTESIKEKVIF